MKSKQSCPRGQGLPNLKTEASSPQLARKRYFDASSNSLIRLTCYFSLNRWVHTALKNIFTLSFTFCPKKLFLMTFYWKINLVYWGLQYNAMLYKWQPAPTCQLI